MKINESILTSLRTVFLLEDYKSAKAKLVDGGASDEEADSLITRHKELKKLNRLDKSLIDIDKIVKEFSVEELKQKLFNLSTQTKSEIKKRVDGKIIAENDEYWVYKIDTPEEAYRFHGLAKWCICSGSKENAKYYFEKYSSDYKHVFYFFVRKQITDPENIWNYIALQRNADKDDVYWDMIDNDHKLSDIPVKLPEFNKPALEKLSFEEKLEKKGIKFEKNANGQYDIDGDIELLYFPDLITNGKLNVKFGKVSGYFSCYKCKKLTSLEGCPREVAGRFDCSYCKNLKSLKGAPEKVGGDFSCSECENLKSLEGCPREIGGEFTCLKCISLTNLKGAPEKVGGSFSCFGCYGLKSLEGAPEKVPGPFSCPECYNLKSLEGAPKEVGGSFLCSSCGGLTNLKGAPESVGGDFVCMNCKNLTSLKGAPRTVGWVFACSMCRSLTNLEGAPEKVGKDFVCSRCGTEFTEDEVRELCDVSGKITT